MMGARLLVVAVCAAGCHYDKIAPTDAGDAAVVDAPDAASDGSVIDATPIDATVDARPVDASVDASAIDATVDARPIDASVDAAVDARPIDASVDAAVDARPIDASVDAPVDAAVDARPIDASPVDAPVDAMDPIPPDVPPLLRSRSVVYSLPPSGWTSGNAWIQAIYDSRYPVAVNSVRVEYLNLYAMTGPSRSDLVVAGPARPTGVMWMQSGTRVPWAAGLVNVPFNAAIVPFSMTPGQNTASLYIAGTDRIPDPPDTHAIPAGATHLRVEVRIMVIGHAMAQVGVDVRMNSLTDSSQRAGASDWILDTGGNWQNVVLDLTMP